jgi:hypothetical protein
MYSNGLTDNPTYLMIQLNRNRYLVLNDTAEVFNSFDDVNRLLGWLVGKRTSHLTVYVVKGYRARLMPVSNDLLEFREILTKTMSEL